ncbi:MULTISPECIES: glycoside hydrolase family 1 protein [Clostridia]|uniref:glycoside hydrolase family 1 protein n=1 Tax=Clostridia TaxID=186801 RepID=UPI0012B39346|nr:glycoside hydrolase family 1 protein [Clostridium sp. WB02_MRS01]MBW4846131.1 glycoside hydrolase family 1 protein [Lachnospiraceae bacterium]MSS10027.1 glycoside hydrolase family 1 protein [Clostridium sp. WB02_MRS01]
MKLEFPEGFYFGSATSATQCEGGEENDGRGKNIWDLWYEEEGYKFHGAIGPGITSAFYQNYKEDIQLMKQTGHNSFRTSISWSRMFPEGFGEVNEKAADYYRSLFLELKENGIEPFVNLYHFDMPVKLQELGGWENRKVVDYYKEYAWTCFNLFGDLVKHWFTFNEPIVHVECGYLQGYHYPCKVDPKAAVSVAYHTALASALAVKEYHSMKQEGKIGIVLNLTPAYPRSSHPEDEKAAKIAELFQNKSFLDPAVKGTYDPELVALIEKHGLLPTVSKEDLEVIRQNTVDFLGVNYYHPFRVCAKANIPNPAAPFMPEYYFDIYDMPGKRMNPYRGWEIYPRGLYDIAVNIRDNYGNIEWMVTENGMGVENEGRFKIEGMIQDDYRIEFYKEHLTWLHKGIEEGSNCIGYHVWTFVDCWSWLNAYKNRYGLVELDLENQKRTIKKSGYWYQELLKNNGFETAK